MCYCPICKKHCSAGVTEGQTQCEFWDIINGDCRIRKCLELFQKWLEKEAKP